MSGGTSGRSDDNPNQRPLPDYSSAAISNSSVSGILSKLPFRPTQVTLNDCGWNTITEKGKVTDRTRSYQLTFKTDQEFPNEMRLIAFICADERNLDRLVFKARPYKFGTEEYRQTAFMYKGKHRALGMGLTGMHFYTPKKNPVVMFSSEISGRIEFGTGKGNCLPGKIILAAPDGSYITGRFTAKVSRQNPDQ